MPILNEFLASRRPRSHQTLTILTCRRQQKQVVTWMAPNRVVYGLCSNYSSSCLVISVKRMKWADNCCLFEKDRENSAQSTGKKGVWSKNSNELKQRNLQFSTGSPRMDAL